MEIFICIITLIILVETTFLLVKNRRPLRAPTKRKIYIDTSALMDGRIISVAKTGFLSDDFIILKSVTRELQLLADGKDAEKRARARIGLENARALERIVYFDTEILDDGNEHVKVDEQLIKFAKSTHGAILTLDFNLIKVAEIEKVTTLNLNDLKLALRNEFIPGEKTTVKITDKGANKGQGISHLKDGTMVVVDNAANKIGESVEVEFTKLHETSSGKMIFARIVKPSKPTSSSRRKRA